MLAASVNTCKRFFMKQTYKTVLYGNLLHNLHCNLVVVGGNIGSCINGCKLMLSGSNLIMLCLCENPEFPQLFVKLIHVCGYSRLDNTEIVVIHLLTLR